jgi:transcriptional regulator with XRE-family HTH domain
LSQDDLARHLGVSKSFVSKLLNGKKEWPEGIWERAEAFIAGNFEALETERGVPPVAWSVIAFPSGARRKKLKIVTAARCYFRIER